MNESIVTDMRVQICKEVEDVQLASCTDAK